MKSGFVSIVGRPNVGKSTLLNSLIGTKLAITSNKPQTTRWAMQGVYQDEEAQIVFVDTPGIHKPKYKLGRQINKEAYNHMEGVDLLLFLIDVKEPFGKGDSFILEKIKQTEIPTILILNKIDTISKQQLLPLIEKYQSLHDFKEIIPISAQKKENLQELIKTIKKYLKEDTLYYDEDTLTDKSMVYLVQERIREKIFLQTEEEIPYSTTVQVLKMKEKKNVVTILADIIVDRDALKRILIGKQGKRIKEIGMEARKDIEELMGKKVFLELYVKTKQKWRDNEKDLIDFGYIEEKEKF